MTLRGQLKRELFGHSKRKNKRISMRNIRKNYPRGGWEEEERRGRLQ